MKNRLEEAEFQRKTASFMERHIIMNAEEIVKFVSEHGSDTTENYSLIEGMMPDYTGSAMEHLFSEEDQSDLSFYEGVQEETGISDIDLTNAQTARASLLKQLNFAVDAMTYCEAYDIEPDYREIYEYYYVTEWLAEELKKRGESVSEFLGPYPVWSRSCTGQSIYMDCVIRDIFRSVHSDSHDEE